MDSESWHLSVFIDRAASDVYAYVSDPANLPTWALGLGSSVVQEEDGRWFVATAEGRVGFTFVAPNELGVLDHVISLPDGTTVYVPLRVIADGADRCEIVFTLRRAPGMSDQELERDAGLVSTDLAVLKDVLEAGPAPA
ncbi:polyketide cyclase [Cellulomonas chitinilytica]|uniref:Polyketide cyclase n=1 Tax=Cellulomonas chitinilytica TaxID=398759 RepID=A0A919U364_9CELL|nr:SRPBCC family protein [Cellulomonas chitinilytica]GIG23001.1 polyketide cyclase [Cellulomonas chitinilytica]